MRFSRRSRRMPPSPIRKLAPYAEAAKERGIQIYHLNIGQPDIETPPVMMEAIREYRDPVLAYGPSQGLPGLRSAIRAYFERYDISLALDDIMVTTAGSEAIHFAYSVICDPEDEIIVFEPFYANYRGFATAVGCRLVPIRTDGETGFHLPPREVIEAAITPRTRAIQVCSPNNPTGTVLRREEMEMLGEIARERDLFLISDEVYKEFCYDGECHTSVLELPGLEDRAVLTDSISKRFSACGARVGTLICRNPGFIQWAHRYGMARLCPPTLEQIGAEAAYRMPQEYFRPIAAEYTRRRDALMEELERLPGVFCRRPSGAFYLMARLPVEDTDHFAQWLLESFESRGETLMVSPGSGFYETEGAGKDEVRIAYVLEVPKIRRAIQILGEALQAYPRR